MPFQSEAQRRLMYAAAAGKNTKADISQAEAKRMVSHDEPGKLPEKVEKAGEGDGSDMAKQFLAEINEMSEKINSMIDGKQELEDWVDGKITRAKTDLSDISGYLKHNKNILVKAKQCCDMLTKKKQMAEKSIHGSKNTPDRVANTVDGIAKADNGLGDYEMKAKGALDFRNQMKDFRRQHGSTIMDIAGGRRIPADRADAYHAARGQLTIGHGVSPQDIPPKIPGHLIDRPKVQAQEIKPLVLPAAKSMAALANPKSLVEKIDDFKKCMYKSSGEELEKSSKKKSKPFHGYNKKKHARSGGLNDSYRKKLNRETGSNLKRPVTKKNVKPGSKAAKRRKSFCARMSGVKGPTSKGGKLTPKGAALKRWRCSKSLNKSESVPLELRAYRAIAKLEKAIPAVLGTIARAAAPALIEAGVNAIADHFDKSNNLKPFGTNVYDNTANLGRKLGRVGLEAEGLGPNTAVQQRGNALHGTMKDQTARETKRIMDLNRKQPVKSVDLSMVPADKKQEVMEAMLSGKSHPLIEQATRILLTNKRKKSGADIVEPTDKSLEKKLSLKGLLTAGAMGASALAGGAQASPESDLHSQLSNLNVMGEYHTPKTGTKAVLKEPGQLKADQSHPGASYTRESTDGSSMGSFYGSDAEKARTLLQNYDTTAGSFKKSNKLKGGKGDESKKSDFSPKQIADGLKVEREHTKDPKVAEEIALDHLTEDPHYYSKLKTSGLADELQKAKQAIQKLEKRCWEGYQPVPGKKPYSKGSCVKKAISAPAMESGEYKGEKLDAQHHNRLGKEYREMARQAIAKGDKQTAAKHQAKSLFHFSRAEEMGYKPPED